MDSTKRLLLIGTSLVGLVLVAVWLLGGGADGTQNDQPGGAESGDIEATSTSAVSSEEDSGPTGGSGTATAGEPAETAGKTQEEPAERATTTEELSNEACDQFAEGRTVADFADWFEDRFQGDEAERTDMFRAVITRALTNECPEVVPDS